jgi:hypothetical protein
MGVRHVPELSFLADRSERFQTRIEEIMDRTRRRAAKHGQAAGEESHALPKAGGPRQELPLK